MRSPRVYLHITLLMMIQPKYCVGLNWGQNKMMTNCKIQLSEWLKLRLLYQVICLSLLNPECALPLNLKREWLFTYLKKWPLSSPLCTNWHSISVCFRSLGVVFSNELKGDQQIRRTWKDLNVPSGELNSGPSVWRETYHVVYVSVSMCASHPCLVIWLAWSDRASTGQNTTRKWILSDCVLIIPFINTEQTTQAWTPLNIASNIYINSYMNAKKTNKNLQLINTSRPLTCCQIAGSCCHYLPASSGEYSINSYQKHSEYEHLDSVR